MGLSDIVKKVADVFVDSSAPGMITNAAQYGAKQLQSQLGNIPMGGIGGDQFGQAMKTAQSGMSDIMGGMPGGDLFGGVMRNTGSSPFGSAMGGANPSRNGNMFGTAMYAGKNPWSMDSGFSPRWEEERAKRDAENLAWLEEEQRKADEAASGGYGWGASGLAGGDASQAQKDKIKGTDQWDAMIQKAATEAGVPASIIKGLMAIESGGNATIGTNTSGATGLMQVVGSIWQGTANQFGGDLNDPWTNIRTAAEILKGNKAQYGTWEGAIAAYLGSPKQDASGAWVGGDVPDAFGTTGQMYVQIAKNNVAFIESQAGGTGGPSMTGEAANPWAGGALNAAAGVIGMPYVWGGESHEEGGFDCSGLIVYAYNKAGKPIPRDTSQGMYAKYQHVDANNLKAGDLVFFHFPGGEAGANHVAMFDGTGWIQATSNGSTVKRTPVTWGQEYIIGYRRVT